MIKLVPIDAVRASEYNPRRNDEKRLALTELSLRKLGFLLPIYADESGEILSGHQRHLVASRMGFRQIPVEYVSGKTLVSASSLEKDFACEGTKTDAAKQVGVTVAERAKAKGIDTVVFDRGGYVYHGRVKALAEGAREGGLKL